MFEALSGRTRLIEGCGVTVWPDGNLSSCYRFCHAIYREVLYQDIPEARRSRLHRMIGDHLRAAFGAEDASLASVLAVHFENGRDTESAALYRRMAGERALGLHAYHEAAQHLEKALEAFDQARSRPAEGDPEDAARWELDVCTTLGMALAVTHGHGAAEVEKAHARARPLIEGLDNPAAQFPTLFNLWSLSTSAADLTESKRLVTRMSEVVARADNDEMALMFHSAKLRIAFFYAEYAESADSVRQALTLCGALRDQDLASRYPQEEPGAIALGVDAWRLWLQGCPAQAATRDRETRELAKHLDSPYGRAFAWAWSLASLQFRGETEQLERRAGDLHRHCTEHGFPTWTAWATFFEGWVVGARANEAEGIALMEKGLDGWKGAGIRVVEPYLLALLSETCLRAGRIEAAGERLAEARDRVEKTGEGWWEAELHRLQGEVLLVAAEDGGRDGDSSDRAEACFRTALEVARRQQARSLELRAALSLSRLWSQNRPDEARRLLGGVLETFTEGHDTADLRAASEQMAQLSQAD
jgi:adenylate cyclase